MYKIYIVILLSNSKEKERKVHHDFNSFPSSSQGNVNQSLTRFMISEDKVAVVGSDPLNEAARICTDR